MTLALEDMLDAQKVCVKIALEGAKQLIGVQNGGIQIQLYIDHAIS
jgi:hypothetical protein